MTKAELIEALAVAPDDAEVSVAVRVTGLTLEVHAQGNLRNVYYDPQLKSVVLKGELLTGI